MQKLSAKQWAEITENRNFPKSLTSKQIHIIDTALFAYYIDGDIADLDNEMERAGVYPPELGVE